MSRANPAECRTCHLPLEGRALYHGALYDDVRTVIQMMVREFRAENGNVGYNTNMRLTDKYMTKPEVVNLYQPAYDAKYQGRGQRYLYFLRPAFKRTKLEDESFRGWVTRFILNGNQEY